MTKIDQHPCWNVQQDALHGKGLRLFNSMKKKDEWRCSGCGAPTCDKLKKLKAAVDEKLGCTPLRFGQWTCWGVA